jgi:hypothetical protein
MRVIGVVLIVAALMAGIGVVAAGVLALGSLLSHWFAVNTFEASLVVMAAGWVVVQVVRVLTMLPEVPVAPDSEGEILDQEPTLVFNTWSPLTAMPTRRNRRRRKQSTPAK